jgi:peptide chain release factor 2
MGAAWFRPAPRRSFPSKDPMRDFTDDLAALRQRVTDATGYLRVDDARARLTELEADASRPDLWDDADAARKVTTELARVREDVELVDVLDARVADLETLYELAREELDDSFETEIASGIAGLDVDLKALEMRALFTGEHDERDAICEVHSGAGGTDAQDWAQMLLRMYQRWGERHGFNVEIDELSYGTEAGISSATFIVRGRYAYGMLTGEKGVHRIVRISPFDSQARRQTAFASFDAVPSLEAEEMPEIDDKDLRIDTYRSSGAGGQHVNVTDSAVRITHLPTGVVVSCQNERSQLQNRAKAMQILAARLAQRNREEQKAKLEALSGEKRDVAWGSQIRSYVFAPYQLVKDERTRSVNGHDEPIYETGNVLAVMDGDIDDFVDAFLQWRRSNRVS